MVTSFKNLPTEELERRIKIIESKKFWVNGEKCRIQDLYLQQLEKLLEEEFDQGVNDVFAVRNTYQHLCEEYASRNGKKRETNRSAEQDTRQ